jgi:hypothetical protein
VSYCPGCAHFAAQRERALALRSSYHSYRGAFWGAAVAPGRTVQINYLVRGGRVIDVYLNGTVSDLATRRDEFASILAGGGGADALVKTLRERTATLLGS